MPTVLFSAGDVSGDAHAANLIRALRRRDPGLSCVGLGGSAMQAAGMELLQDLTATAAIGPFDAAKHLSELQQARRRFAECLDKRKPDLVVLVDFGDFNLPFIAPLASARGVRVAYFISPQIWAWGRWRLKYVRKHVSRMLALFPFEKAFYEEAGVPVTWVGHPLIEQAKPKKTADAARKEWGINPVRMTVGLLPGSRPAEIRRLLPLLRDAAERIARSMPGVQFLVPVAPGLTPEALAPGLASDRLSVCFSQGNIQDALQLMDAAVVCSGTATLETALAGVPLAVVYRTSWPTFLAARIVMRTPHIALANIVAGKPLVPEFVQRKAEPKAIAELIVSWLRDEPLRLAKREELQAIREKLGPPGAIERAAEAILGELKEAPLSAE